MVQEKAVISVPKNAVFGIEIEINSFDGKSKPSGGGNVKGIEDVSFLLSRLLNDQVFVKGWHLTHNNTNWLIKPDSSCGMEICTPVFNNLNSLNDILHVIEHLKNYEKVKSDERCSLHVHVGMNDLDKDQILNVLTAWVKSELVIMDMFPYKRKKNRYCQFFGMSKFNMNCENNIGKIRDIIYNEFGHKYYSVNIHHMMKQARKSIEFRTMENDCCLNPWDAKNWIRFCTYFVNHTKNISVDNIKWYDPLEFFEFMNFTKELSPGMTQVRNWVLERMSRFIIKEDDYNINPVFSGEFRKVARKELSDLYDLYYTPVENYEKAVFDDEFLE